MVGARSKSAGEGDGKLLLNEDRVSVCGDEKFWRWMIVMVAQQCEYTQCCRAVHLKSLKGFYVVYILSFKNSNLKNKPLRAVGWSKQASPVKPGQGDPLSPSGGVRRAPLQPPGQGPPPCTSSSPSCSRRVTVTKGERAVALCFPRSDSHAGLLPLID